MSRAATTVISWEDPPAKVERGGGGIKHNWEGIGRALVRRPHRWAHVATCPSAHTASNVAGYVRAKQAFGLYVHSGQFEAVSRTVDGEYRVYARYMGGTR